MGNRNIDMMHTAINVEMKSDKIADEKMKMYSVSGTIEAIGNDLDFRGRIASPTLKIAEMMVAGN